MSNEHNLRLPGRARCRWMLTTPRDGCPTSEPEEPVQPASPVRMIPSEDAQAISTALSTLTARVAVLERWMRRSRGRELALLLVVLIALAATVCALVWR